MRNVKTLFISAIPVMIITAGLACSHGQNPITLDPDSPGITRLAFATGIVARFNQATGEVWIGAPPGTAGAGTLVRISIPGESPRQVRALPDGSFLYRFAGNRDSSAVVGWTAPDTIYREKEISVSDPSDGLFLNVAPAGLYPNRLTVMGDVAWVVNSGDDQLTSYDIATLTPTGRNANVPKYSNPWEAAFSSSTTGILTTLFGGVFAFDTGSGSVKPVTTDGFRPFASPNGCTITGRQAWVANPNPISYFPTLMGHGWVSDISLGDAPSVMAEVNTRWLNPQNVISDGTFIYVSCSGTIDFLPPAYNAVALDTGGVQIINAATREIVASYELGKCGPGPMALSPDKRFLYVGSAVAGRLFRIDLEQRNVLNDASNPIVISDHPGTYVPFVKITPEGLLVCASFNTDTIRFLNSWTGEVDPFPFFGPVALHPDDPGLFYGIQDAALCRRDGKRGLLILTTVNSAFHWLPL